MNRAARGTDGALMLARLLVLTSPLLAGFQKPPGQTVPPLTIDQRFDRRHGLSHNTVLCVIQDRVGFLWIGTIDGLNRFDGKTFLQFQHDPNDSTSLSSSTVRRILEDSQGNLWIRTESGLDRLDRSSGRFRRYPLQPFALLEGPSPARRLLVAAPQGLFRYTGAGDRFELIVPFPLSSEDHSPSRNDPVWGALQVGDTTWLSTESGHLFALPAGGGVVHFRTPWRKTIVARTDPSGRLWIGHNAGVAILDPRTRQSIETEVTRAVSGAIVPITAAENGGVWLGGDRLYWIDPSGTRVVSVPMDASDAAFPSSPVLSILLDREGGIWLATPSGLRHGDPYAKEFGYVRHDPANPNSLSGDAVMSLAQTDDGALWAGTLGAGLNRLDLATGRVRRYASCGDDVWSLHPDRSRERLWVGTERGLCALNLATGSTARVSLAGRDGRDREPIVSALALDHSGQLWIGTTAGLFRVDPLGNHSIPLPRAGPDRPLTPRVEGLAVSRDGTLWAGTSWSDLYHIDPRSGRITPYALGDAPALRGSEGFWAIAELADGRILLGSDRGLFGFAPETGALRAIGPAQGVPEGPVFAILPDRNAVWVSMGLGLLRHGRPEDLGGASGGSRFYSQSDGLPYPEFNRRAALPLADGRLVFGGMGGITIVDPQRLRDNPHPPPVVVTAVERYRRTGPVHLEPYRLDVVRLAHDDVGITFQFAALTYTNPASTAYSVRLEGFDRDWNPTGTQPLARYPALPPGRYTFRVRAANADGIWNDDGASLAVLVPPPWWATWWFRGSAGLIGMGSLALALRQVATRRLRRRIRELELEQRVRVERDRIARDLHDSVGSHVSTILAGIELLELDAGRGDPQRTGRYVEALKHDAGRTLTLLRDTVWSLHQDRVSGDALAERIQEHLRERQRYLPTATLSFAAAGALTASLPAAHALHLFRIVQEAVTNAIRHAAPHNVRVGLRTDPTGAVTLTIADDGTHREPQPGHPGQGVDGMRTRAVECGGSFEFGPGDPGGSLVRVRLPGLSARP